MRKARKDKEKKIEKDRESNAFFEKEKGAKCKFSKRMGPTGEF